MRYFTVPIPLLALLLLGAGCDDAQDSGGSAKATGEFAVCHEAEGGYQLLDGTLGVRHEHVSHGDGIVGGPVPAQAGFLFSETCEPVRDAGGACPAGMALVDGFCIDRWEAHVADHSPFATGALGGAGTAAEIIPQGYISGDEAAAACAAVGKRLCSGSEWLRACQGPRGWTFPYGPEYDETACNEGREQHPVVQLFGDRTDWSKTQMNDPRINQQPATLGLTGGNPACVTAEGVYDMHGNLHEWVAAASGTFRGGFYVDAEINGEGCTYRTTAHGRSYHDYSTGFRCCADPAS